MPIRLVYTLNLIQPSTLQPPMLPAFHAHIIDVWADMLAFRLLAAESPSVAFITTICLTVPPGRPFFDQAAVGDCRMIREKRS